MVNISNSTSFISALSSPLNNQVVRAFSERQKKIMIIALSVFSLLGVIYSYRRQLSDQANKVILRLLQPVAVPLEEIKGHIATLCQQAASDIKTKIFQQCPIHNIQSAKIFISVREKDKVWKEEACIIQGSSNLGTEIDRICANFPQDIVTQLEGGSLSNLSISWDIYLKDKDENFHRIYDYRVKDRLAFRCIHRTRAYQLSAEGMMREEGKVVNDQLEFI